MSLPINLKKTALILMLATTLAACSDDNDNVEDTDETIELPTQTSSEFSITFTNLTPGQPLSPLSAIAFQNDSPWQFGQAASTGLEMVAESGDNTEFLLFEDAISSASAEAGIGPGESTTFTLSTEALENINLSFAAMLGNTNDAFTGLSKVDVSLLAVGDSLIELTSAYDAGTEANTESSSTVPGPASGGEGFNAMRDDIADVITMHPGIVSNQDGLTTSVLGAEHKFDNPVAKIVITRMQ